MLKRRCSTSVWFNCLIVVFPLVLAGTILGRADSPLRFPRTAPLIENSYSVQILSLWPVSGAIASGNTKLWAQVKNIGSGSLPSGANVWFWLDGPSWINHWIGSTSAAGLAPGKDKWIAFEWSIPANAVEGKYTYWAQVWTSTAISDWSTAQEFVVTKGGVPGKAILITPNGAISSTAPAYTWTAVASATWYYLWVNDGTGLPKIQTWYTAGQAGCSSGSGTCTMIPTTALAGGACQWWIQTWNPSGYGSWSDAMDFTVGGGGLGDVATSWNAGAPPDLLGFKPFHPSNEWYRDVSSAPVDPDSVNIIADLVRDDPGTMLHPDFGSSLYEGNPVGMAYDVVAGALTPKVDVTIGPDGYADESDPGPDNAADRVPIPIPIPADVHIEGGFDHHILLLDKDNYWLYEIYHAVRREDGSWQADQVTLWDLNDNTRRPWTWTSADQAGLSIFAGLVRYDEVQRALPANGDLGHAIRFTVMPTQEPFIPPATHPGGGNDGTIHSPKMGQRFRLKAAWLAAHLPEFSSQCQVILRTLARHGMILADTGSSLFIQGTRDARWVEDEDAGGVAQLLRVPPNAFEVVAHGVEYTRDSHPMGSPPVIVGFTATPASVSRGDAVNLAWELTGASTLIITPGVGPVRGTSNVVHPTATTIYTIFATNEFGRSTHTVTITVH